MLRPRRRARQLLFLLFRFNIASSSGYATRDLQRFVRNIHPSAYKNKLVRLAVSSISDPVLLDKILDNTDLIAQAYAMELSVEEGLATIVQWHQ